MRECLVASERNSADVVESASRGPLFFCAAAEHAEPNYVTKYWIFGIVTGSLSSVNMHNNGRAAIELPEMQCKVTVALPTRYRCEENPVHILLEF